MAYRSNRSSRSGSSGPAADLAYGLGWFSIGLGAMEVMAPGALARALGMRGRESLLQAYGLREIANGVAILASDDPTPWIWARVGGDALDLATLASAYHDDNPRKGNVGLALAAVGAVTALDAACAAALSAGVGQEPRRIYQYGDRSGMPLPPRAMRGAAGDFAPPRDFRTPEALRPYTETNDETSEDRGGADPLALPA